MIKPESLNFLEELAANNNREWFAIHKPRYEAAKEDVLNWVEELVPLLAATDPAFPLETNPKKCLMRIYRDVRFSKNKDPYKNNYGISFAVKQNGGPDYYLHIQPGKSFFAAGSWMPQAPDLKLIREEIDYSADEFQEIVNEKQFSSQFELSYSDTLKKAPKGYDPEHPMIDYLRLKSFIASFPISDTNLFKPEINNQLKKAFQGVYPFVSFLRKALDQ
ncbi:DUF2461 domain-containing protein [Pedobacter antarcticus]|uniref:DUF2461 domain-containing protein n=1 Tax=Pedobacter antarcticus TaxID=34086 RepID=UPI00292E3BCF|nr:DUF2461 domain-containing protein [Pedobacter antarcticus]